MQIYFTDLNAINLNDFRAYLIYKGWKLSDRQQYLIYKGSKLSDRQQRFPQNLVYSKNNHELLLIDPSYFDYENRLCEALETLLCVEEIKLLVKFRYSPKTIAFQRYIGVISGHDIQKLLTNFP